MEKLFLVVAMLGSLAGCHRAAQTDAPRPAASGLWSMKQAGRNSYPYAFSGQVFDESSHEVIHNFSVDVATNNFRVNVLNSLGDATGTFHLSRTPAPPESPSLAMPLIISAPGFISQIQMVDVGSDCAGNECAREVPTPIRLKKRGRITAEAEAPEMARGERLSKVIVLLGPLSVSQNANYLRTLLSGSKDEKLKTLISGVSKSIGALAPLLASSNPDVISAIFTVAPLLPYFNPVKDRLLSPRMGILGQIVGIFVKDDAIEQNLLTLVAAVVGRTSPQFRSRWGLNTLHPTVDGVLNRRKFKATMSQGILINALEDPSLLNTLLSFAGRTGARLGKHELLLRYTKPLLEGFSGHKGSELRRLFNELVETGGMSSLKNLETVSALKERYSELLPYLEQIADGLNSQEAQVLASQLRPYLKKRNPASALNSLSEEIDLSRRDKWESVVSALYPGAPGMLNQAIPAKQIFASQLIKGIVEGEFKDLKIVQDLRGVPAIVVSGSRGDIQQLSKLPNVTRVYIAE